MKRLVMALASIALVGAAPDPLANWTPAERAAIDTTLSHAQPGDYATPTTRYGSATSRSRCCHGWKTMGSCMRIASIPC